MSILNLPTEILLEVFSDFDYFTLRFKVVCTCRRFRDVIEGVAPNLERLEGPLAEVLHRDKVSDASLSRIRSMSGLRTYIPPDWPASTIPTFRYHPMLPLLRTCRSVTLTPLKIEDIGFEDKAGNFTPLIDTFVAKENIITPAYDYVGFMITWRDYLRGREECERRSTVIDGLGSGDAITVQNFIIGFLSIFNIEFKLNEEVFKKRVLFDKMFGMQVRNSPYMEGAVVAEILLHVTNF